MKPDNDPSQSPSDSTAPQTGGRDAAAVAQFRFWNCFGRAAASVWKNWGLFLIICVPLYGGDEILGAYRLDGTLSSLMSEFDASNSLVILSIWFLLQTLLYFPGFFLSIVADVIIVYIVVAQLRGFRFSAISVIGRLREIILPLFLFCMIEDLVVTTSYYFWQITLFVFAAFFWLSAQSICIEKLGAIAAMKRSMYLTSGYRWRFSCVVIAIFVLWELEEAAAGFLAAQPFYDLFQFAHINALALFSTGVMGSFIATLLATAYYDLRSVKELAPDRHAIEAFD